MNRQMVIQIRGNEGKLSDLLTQGVITEIEEELIFTHLVTEYPFRSFTILGHTVEEIIPFKDGDIYPADIAWMRYRTQHPWAWSWEDIRRHLGITPTLFTRIRNGHVALKENRVRRNNPGIYTRHGDFPWWEHVGDVDTFYRTLADVARRASMRWKYIISSDTLSDYFINYISHRNETNFPQNVSVRRMCISVCQNICSIMYRRFKKYGIREIPYLDQGDREVAL